MRWTRALENGAAPRLPTAACRNPKANAAELARGTTSAADLIVAVVTNARSVVAMMGQRDIAVLAAHDLSAGRALNVRGEPARFSSRDDLPLDAAPVHSRCSSLTQAPRGSATRLVAHINDRHVRQRPIEHALGISPASAAACAACQLSNDGVAEPSTSGILPVAPAARDVSSVISRGGFLFERRLVLFVNHDQPRCGSGANTALRAPTTTCTSPRAMRCHSACRAAAEVAVQHGDASKRARKRRRVCGVKLISGTSTIACRPKLMACSIARM